MNFNAQNVKIAGFPFRVIKTANNSSKKRESEVISDSLYQ